MGGGGRRPGEQGRQCLAPVLREGNFLPCPCANANELGRVARGKAEDADGGGAPEEDRVDVGRHNASAAGQGSDSQRRRHARESAEVAAAALLPSLVLVADESTGTIGKRLASINVENVEENRRALRELLFTVPCVLDCLSVIILFEETLYQSTRDGTPFVDVLAAAGVLAGIKVDKGTAELAGTDRETTTQGHAGLGERCRRYYAASVRFAKWRAVLSIGASKPSQLAVDANAQA
uniref:fructose-bisphosphate aldolase n=1 Tax=Oryza glumipatula TaxID=40148 RepID=A0A0D9ZL98_9ORYZ